MSNHIGATNSTKMWIEPMLFPEEEIRKIETVAVVCETPPEEISPHHAPSRKQNYILQSLF